MKKALFGTQSDDEVSTSSDEEETTNTANLCLMGLKDEVISLEPQSKFTFNELILSFHELMFEFKKAGSRIKTLKNINEALQDESNKISEQNKSLQNDINVLSENYIALEDEKRIYIEENRMLSNENTNLKTEVEKLKPLVDILILSSNNLELLLKD